MLRAAQRREREKKIFFLSSVRSLQPARMVVSNIVALSVSEFFCAQMPSSGVIAAPPCLYVFVQCMCCLLLAVEYFWCVSTVRRARACLWHLAPLVSFVLHTA